MDLADTNQETPNDGQDPASPIRASSSHLVPHAVHVRLDGVLLLLGLLDDLVLQLHLVLLLHRLLQVRRAERAPHLGSDGHVHLLALLLLHHLHLGTNAGQEVSHENTTKGKTGKPLQKGCNWPP